MPAIKITPKTVKLLAEHAQAIRRLGKRVIGEVIEIGRLLIDAKELAGRGNWSSWLKREFGWSQDTAERFMSLHRLQGKIPQIAESDIPVSGLYLLAAKNTPEKVVEAVLERAEKGERFTTSSVKKIVDDAKPAPLNYNVVYEKREPQILNLEVHTAPPQKQLTAADSHDSALINHGPQFVRDDVLHYFLRRCCPASLSREEALVSIAGAVNAAQFDSDLQDLIAFLGDLAAARSQAKKARHDAEIDAETKAKRRGLKVVTSQSSPEEPTATKH